jgi:hypothetical protein
MDWSSSRDATGIRSARCGACGVTQNQGRSRTDRTVVTTAAAVRAAHDRKALAWSKTDPGSGSVLSHWAGPKSHSRIDFPIFKLPPNFEIQICCLPNSKNV